MPLFGSKKHNDVQETTNHGALRDDRPIGTTGTTENYGSGGGGGGRHAAPLNAGNGFSGHHGQTTGLNDPAYNQGHYNQPTGLGSDRYGTVSGTGTGTGGTGVRSGAHPGGVDVGLYHNNIPPAGTLNNSNQNRGGTGQRMTGKVESAIGSLVGSNALKAKGLQKEQEANAIKMQGQELAEAERLEREALQRRERAVGHGAHPDNMRPGGGRAQGNNFYEPYAG